MPRPKKNPRDWHPEDIKAALRKRGWTFNRIAREHGYARTTPKDVIRRGSRPLEAIVAEILGTTPAKIWPSRYTDRRSGSERLALEQAARAAASRIWDEIERRADDEQAPTVRTDLRSSPGTRVSG